MGGGGRGAISGAMPGISRPVMKVLSEQGASLFWSEVGQVQRDRANKNHKPVSWGRSEELYPCLYYFPLVFFFFKFLLQFYSVI